MKKNERIEIRVSGEEKTKLIMLAKSRNLSITEFLLASTQNVPLKDYSHEKLFLEYLMRLTKDIHYLGNNINQVTKAIHQINNGHQPLGNELQQFNRLLEQYVSMRVALSQQLSHIFFK